MRLGGFASGCFAVLLLTLTWTDTNDGLASTRIERGLSNFGPFGALTTVGAGITSYADSEPGAGTTYCYRVAAVSGTTVSAWSNIACGTVPSPPAHGRKKPR